MPTFQFSAVADSQNLVDHDFLATSAAICSTLIFSPEATRYRAAGFMTAYMLTSFSDSADIGARAQISRDRRNWSYSTEIRNATRAKRLTDTAQNGFLSIRGPCFGNAYPGPIAAVHYLTPFLIAHDMLK